jgi:hypothetical protein
LTASVLSKREFVRMFLWVGHPPGCAEEAQATGCKKQDGGRFRHGVAGWLLGDDEGVGAAGSVVEVVGSGKNRRVSGGSEEELCATGSDLPLTSREEIGEVESATSSGGEEIEGSFCVVAVDVGENGGVLEVIDAEGSARGWDGNGERDCVVEGEDVDSVGVCGWGDGDDEERKEEESIAHGEIPFSGYLMFRVRHSIGGVK